MILPVVLATEPVPASPTNTRPFCSSTKGDSMSYLKRLLPGPRKVSPSSEPLTKVMLPRPTNGAAVLKTPRRDADPTVMSPDPIASWWAAITMPERISVPPEKLPTPPRRTEEIST